MCKYLVIGDSYFQLSDTEMKQWKKNAKKKKTFYDFFFLLFLSWEVPRPKKDLETLKVPGFLYLLSGNPSTHHIRGQFKPYSNFSKYLGSLRDAAF